MICSSVRRFGHSVLLLFLTLAFSAAALAQNEAAVDNFMQQQLAAQSLPGASVAVIRDGNVFLAKGYGLANVERKVPATAETIYEIASVTNSLRQRR